MHVLITNGIKVGVVASYQPAYARPAEQQYLFAYHVLIENMGSEPVQLLRRHWIIVDATGLRREVEGEGVIGQQPTLAPGEQHEYNSWCQLPTSVGKMFGSYEMVNLRTGRTFRAQIPHFDLVASPRLN